MVPSIFGKSMRRRLAVAVMVAYGAPSALALATEAVHAGKHAVEVLASERDRLASMGLVDGFSATGLPATSRQDSLDRDVPASDAFVHEHDGTRHAHGGLLGGALDMEWTDRSESGETAVVLALALHLPGGSQTTPGLAPLPTAGPTVDLRPQVLATPTPPVPPPRV